MAKDNIKDTASNREKRMAKYIGEITGSCPLDIFDYYKIECEKVCEVEKGRTQKDRFYQCWIDYFNDPE